MYAGNCTRQPHEIQALVSHKKINHERHEEHEKITLKAAVPEFMKLLFVLSVLFVVIIKQKSLNMEIFAVRAFVVDNCSY